MTTARLALGVPLAPTQMPGGLCSTSVLLWQGRSPQVPNPYLRAYTRRKNPMNINSNANSLTELREDHLPFDRLIFLLFSFIL